LKHTAVIPFGGFVITRDIKEGCGILQKHAEELKLKYGSAFGDLADPNKVVVLNTAPGREQREISFRTLAQIIQARMTEIIDMAMFEVENSGYEERLNGGIVITGGGALLQHLPQLFHYKTGMETRVGYPGKHFSENDAEYLNSPIYSTGLGLILMGYNWLDENAASIKIKAETSKEEVKNQVAEPAEEPVAPEKEPSDGKKSSLIDSLKTSIAKLFNDNDDEYLN